MSLTWWGLHLGHFRELLKTNDLKCGIQVIGFSTMTTHLLTLFCPYLNFWPWNKMTVVPHPLYSSDLSHGPYLPKTQDGFAGKETCSYKHGPNKSVGCTQWVSNNAHNEMLHILVWSMATLYKFPQRPFWRGQHWSEGKCYCYGEINSVQKLFFCTMYLSVKCLTFLLIGHFFFPPPQI